MHIPIAPSGLYWTTELSEGQLRVPGHGQAAQLNVTGLEGIDEPKYPANGPVYRARQGFHVTWHATGDTRVLEDPAKYFRIEGRQARVTAQFTASVPSHGFTFHGHATSTVYGFLGHEVNGHYYRR